MKNYCVKCGSEIPEARMKVLPLTKTCVNCSETGRKSGMTVQLGEGDHTFNEILILDPETRLDHTYNSKLGDIEDTNEGEIFMSLKEIESHLDKEPDPLDFEPEPEPEKDTEEDAE